VSTCARRRARALQNILDVREVRFSYSGCKVLDGVTFGVRKGEFLGILGPNASGKTTLLRCITGTLAPCSGDVVLVGKRISSLTRRELARIVSVVPQHGFSQFDFTVEEFVAMGRLPYLRRFRKEQPEDWAKVRWAMHVTGTANLGSRLITALSGGERQRVMVAKALAQDPQVLTLDEPTSHLDINYQIEMLDLIKKLNLERGLTVLTVLHDPNLASTYCDSVVLLSKGSVFAIGPPARVFTEKTMGDLYGMRVIVIQHPVTLRPLIVPLSRLATKEAVTPFECTVSQPG